MALTHKRNKNNRNKHETKVYLISTVVSSGAISSVLLQQSHMHHVRHFHCTAATTATGCIVVYFLRTTFFCLFQRSVAVPVSTAGRHFNHRRVHTHAHSREKRLSETATHLESQLKIERSVNGLNILLHGPLTKKQVIFCYKQQTRRNTRGKQIFWKKTNKQHYCSSTYHGGEDDDGEGGGDVELLVLPGHVVRLETEKRKQWENIDESNTGRYHNKGVVKLQNRAT